MGLEPLAIGMTYYFIFCLVNGIKIILGLRRLCQGIWQSAPKEAMHEEVQELQLRVWIVAATCTSNLENSFFGIS